MISDKEGISVVMACYDGDEPSALERAIDSILNQTIGYKEFLIVVDGPVRNSLSEVLWQARKKDDRISILQTGENQGAASARNLGMQNSSGHYIAIMDSDDICAPQRLEVQLASLKSNGVDAVWSWQQEFWDESGELVGVKCAPETHDEIANSLKFRCLLPDPSTFMKRECFEATGGYAEDRSLGTDHHLFLSMFLQGFKFYCVPCPLIFVRVSAKQRKRRGGLHFALQDIRLRRWMYSKGLINPWELIWMSLVHVAFRAQPNFVRDLLYRFVLRKD